MSNGGNGVMSNYIMVMCLEPATQTGETKGNRGKQGETKGNRTIVISLNCPKELTMYCVCLCAPLPT